MSATTARPPAVDTTFAIAATIVRHVDAADPAAAAIRSALDLPPGGRITVLAVAPCLHQTLLCEVYDAAGLEKRYLYCNDRQDPQRVTVCTPQQAAQLVDLLSLPDYHVTAIDARAALQTYYELEETDPSAETLRNGHPRDYLPPILPARR